MVLSSTSILYSLNKISGMKSRLRSLERLHTSEFFLSTWQKLRKQIYFITNVLSWQKRKKVKDHILEIFHFIAFVMAHSSRIIISMFVDAHVPRTHGAIKKSVVLLAHMFSVMWESKKILVNSVFALADLESEMSTEYLGIHRGRTKLPKTNFWD